MGISGLLPFLKNASRPVHIEEMSGQVAAVDVYCWLHKGAFGCADKLVQSQKTDGYVVYVMKFVDMLLHHDIKPILVFDGRNLPSKAATEAKRREKRTKYRKMAREYLQEGKLKEARECFQRCVDITPDMAREVIRACNQRNVDCIVAPYEADAQLAFLATTGGFADFVISEDSDLTLFGCEKIVFKLDSSGNGVLYDKSKLPSCLANKAAATDNFTFNKFRYMGIMAGCDYLPSLHGIGLGKSCKFWGKVTNPNLHQVLKRIPSYLNMPQLKVTDEYIQGFIQADQTFLYQIVFDPRTKRFRPLQDYPSHHDEDFRNKLLFAGSMIEEDLQMDYALGNLDIKTLQKVGDFDPDLNTADDLPPKTKYGTPALTHMSIWDRCFDKTRGFRLPKEEDTVEAKRKADRGAIASCFSSKTVNNKVPEAKKKNPVVVTAKPVIQVVSEEQIYNTTSEEEVFVSKYFGRGGLDQPTATTRQKRLTPETEVAFSPPPNKKLKLASTPKAETATSWFEALDDADPADQKSLVYDVTTRRPSPQAASSVALSKPFKPPAMKTPPPQTQSDGENARKRNPFAKKYQQASPPTNSPLKISLSQVSTRSLTSESDWYSPDVDVQNEEEENSPYSNKLPTSAPLKITQATEKSRSSEPLDPESTSDNKNAGKHSNSFAKTSTPLPSSIKMTPSGVTTSTKNSSNGNSSKPLSVVESPPPLAKKKLFQVNKTVSDVVSGSSGYFKPKLPTAKVSGLLKKNKQPTILAMFKRV